MQEVLEELISTLPYVIGGIPVTLCLVAGALGIGFICGIVLAVAQVYGPRPAKLAVKFYVWFFRGTPILLLFYLIWYGILTELEIDMPPIVGAAIIMGLASTAYQSQIFRGAMEALPEGQMKAARALGMSDIKAFRGIILPQALRISLPGWSNEYSIVLKDSAIAYLVGVTDIMSRAKVMADANTINDVPFIAANSNLIYYVMAGVIFFVITVAGLKLLRLLEKYVRIPGYAN